MSLRRIRSLTQNPPALTTKYHVLPQNAQLSNRPHSTHRHARINQMYASIKQPMVTDLSQMGISAVTPSPLLDPPSQISFTGAAKTMRAYLVAQPDSSALHATSFLFYTNLPLHLARHFPIASLRLLPQGTSPSVHPNQASTLTLLCSLTHWTILSTSLSCQAYQLARSQSGFRHLLILQYRQLSTLEQ